jgi:hypothetical protein
MTDEFIGKRFGKLTPLARHQGNGRARWLCECVCGKRKLVRTHDLTSGRTTSCGCSRYSHPRGPTKPVASGTHRFVRRLHAELVRQQTTPDRIADRAGVAASAIKNWLAGRSEPKIGSIDAVLQYLGVELIDRTEQ